MDKYSIKYGYLTRHGRTILREQTFLYGLSGMQPLSRPGPGLLDGIYLLLELQPVYDFRESEFSLWMAPEIGKMLPWGAVYVKPGFGIDNDQDSDRDWTLEVVTRYFFK